MAQTTHETDTRKICCLSFLSHHWLWGYDYGNDNGDDDDDDRIEPEIEIEWVAVESREQTEKKMNES